MPSDRGTNKWNEMVEVSKPSGAIRVYVDLTQLNKYVQSGTIFHQWSALWECSIKQSFFLKTRSQFRFLANTSELNEQSIEHVHNTLWKILFYQAAIWDFFCARTLPKKNGWDPLGPWGSGMPYGWRPYLGVHTTLARDWPKVSSGTPLSNRALAKQAEVRFLISQTFLFYDTWSRAIKVVQTK